MRLLLALLAAASSPTDVQATPSPLPPTCRRALVAYRDPRALPAPYVTLDLSRADTVGGDRLAAAARLGATGYVLAAVPDSLLTLEEREAVAARLGRVSVFRTVAVFVPADSARVQAECRGRVIRSY